MKRVVATDAPEHGAVTRDLDHRRELRMEARFLRARLAEIQPQIQAMSNEAIAAKHGLTVRYVKTVAAAMPWTEDEIPPPSGLPRYYGS